MEIWVELCISEPILEELLGALAEKSQWSTGRSPNSFETPYFGFRHFATPQQSLRVAVDPQDDRILECAIEAQAHAIISGDRDLLALGTFCHIPIMTPRQFLDSALWKK